MTHQKLGKQIYIKIIEGLNKTYGDADPVYTKTYVDNKYGVPNNYVVDGSGNYVLQIINTLDNTTIVDRDDYEPFDKDLLVYHLLRSKDSPGVDEGDVHEGEMVGNYIVNEDYFETIDTEEKAYILGLLYADGFVGNEKFNNIVLSLKK